MRARGYPLSLVCRTLGVSRAGFYNGQVLEALGGVPDPLADVGGLLLAESDRHVHRIVGRDPEGTIPHRLEGEVLDDGEWLVRGGEALDSLDRQGDDGLVDRHIGEQVEPTVKLEQAVWVDSEVGRGRSLGRLVLHEAPVSLHHRLRQRGDCGAVPLV